MKTAARQKEKKHGNVNERKYIYEKVKMRFASCEKTCGMKVYARVLGSSGLVSMTKRSRHNGQRLRMYSHVVMHS